MMLMDTHLVAGFPWKNTAKLLFHKAIYSQHSNTKTAQDGSPEEGCPTKEPHGFYPLDVCLCSTLAPPQFSCPLSVHPSCFCHSSPSLAKRPAIPSACHVFQCPYICLAPLIFLPFAIPKAGSSQPLTSGSHTELSLHFHLHL